MLYWFAKAQPGFGTTIRHPMPLFPVLLVDGQKQFKLHRSSRQIWAIRRPAGGNRNRKLVTICLGMTSQFWSQESSPQTRRNSSTTAASRLPAPGNQPPAPSKAIQFFPGRSAVILPARILRFALSWLSPLRMLHLEFESQGELPGPVSRILGSLSAGDFAEGIR